MFLMELKNDKALGSFFMYEDAYNGRAMVDGKEFELKNYAIDFDYEQKKVRLCKWHLSMMVKNFPKHWVCLEI